MRAEHGRDAAHELVRGVEHAVRVSLRARDRAEAIGEDRFGVVLRDCDAAAMAAIAAKLMRAVREYPYEVGTAPTIAPSVSIGGVVIPEAAGSAAEAIARAEQALAVARGTGGARFVPYRPAAPRTAAVAMATPALLRAISQDGVRLALRPVMEGADTVLGERYAGLLDWRGRALHCGDPAAARQRLARLMVGLDDQDDIRLVLDLRRPCDPAWRAALARLMSRHAALAPRFEIEVADAMAMDDLADHQSFVRELAGIGCRVTLQSYGMGRDAFTHAAAASTARVEAGLLRRLAPAGGDMPVVGLLVDLVSAYGLRAIAAGAARC